MTDICDKPLAERIRRAAAPSARPGGQTLPVLGLDDARRLAKQARLPLARIDQAALGIGVLPRRFLRNVSALSAEDQHRLSRSRAAVVGVGGLGGVVAEILARIGVGALTLIDGDRFEESNLNRQMLGTVGNLETAKAAAAARRVRSVNPAAAVRFHDAFVDEDSAAPLIADADLVVDCLDSISARFAVAAAARAAGKPVVSAAVAGAAGHVTTIFPEDPGLSSIYGSADRAADTGAEAELGCLPHAVFLLASVEASEAVKVVLGRRDLLRNRLLAVDLSANTFEVIHLR